MNHYIIYSKNNLDLSGIYIHTIFFEYNCNPCTFTCPHFQFTKKAAFFTNEENRLCKGQILIKKTLVWHSNKLALLDYPI